MEAILGYSCLFLSVLEYSWLLLAILGGSAAMTASIRNSMMKLFAWGGTLVFTMRHVS